MEKKRSVPFAERLLKKAMEEETKIIESNQVEGLTLLETEGITQKMGSLTVKYVVAGDSVVIDFTYRDYLELGTYKGKVKETKKGGLSYFGKFNKKAPSNLYRNELMLIRESLQRLNFKFKDTYTRKTYEEEGM